MIPIEKVEQRIFLIRGYKVMLDRDLAELYGVQTKALLQAVKRNVTRFPGDFMYQLTQQEVVNLRSQFGVGLIKSVDDSCCCSLISFLIESMLLPIAGVIEGWKPNDCVAINPG